MKINLQRGSPRFASEAGQASRLLLVLAVVVLVAVIITYLIIRMAEKPPQPVVPNPEPVYQPVYDAVLGNIKFNYISALDKGKILRVSEIKNSQYSNYKNNLITGEKFIQVTIGAQNKGTINIERGAWDIENIVDSEGRNFEPLEGSAIMPWLPFPNFCGALLKPAFDPTPCTKIYEVSKTSTGFKIRVKTGKDNKPGNLSSEKAEWVLLDLIVK